MELPCPRRRFQVMISILLRRDPGTWGEPRPGPDHSELRKTGVSQKVEVN